MSYRAALRATRHPVQLSEWWADFDEHVMRPVFNKPDALADWTPRSEGGMGQSLHDLNFQSTLEFCKRALLLKTFRAMLFEMNCKVSTD